MTEIQRLIQAQRDFFNSQATKPLVFRKTQLERMHRLLTDNQTAILDSLMRDLNRPIEHSQLAEMAPLLEEIEFLLANLERLAAPKTVASPDKLQFLGAGRYQSRIIYEPYGVTLTIAPWNYPWQLALAPVIGALAAGNTAIIKPSELTPTVSALLAQLIGQYFAPPLLAVVEGGIETSQALLAEKFDHIFFTGSVPVGKIVMKAAAEHLTPVTLELGGKSPFIVDKSANLVEAAKSLIFSKVMNSGQTCIAPDYVLIDKQVKAPFIQIVRQALLAEFGENPFTNPQFAYAKIISPRHYQRLKNFLSDGTIVAGGAHDDGQSKMLMTLLDGVSWDSPVMNEEIFGSITPVLAFDDLDEALGQITARAKPLALYLFSEDAATVEKVLGRVSFGGGVVNGVLAHFSNANLPFGGVGDSGMGAYHGEYSFYCFSHRKSVVERTIS